MSLLSGILREWLECPFPRDGYGLTHSQCGVLSLLTEEEMAKLVVTLDYFGMTRDLECVRMYLHYHHVIQRRAPP